MRTCPVCGEVFTDPRTKYCSSECYRKRGSLRTNRVRICKTCGETFILKEKGTPGHLREFCSPSCRDRSGLRSPRQRSCKACGETFVLKKKGEPERHNDFCSTRCYNAQKQARDREFKARRAQELGYVPCKVCLKERPSEGKTTCDACGKASRSIPSSWLARKARALQNGECAKRHCQSKTLPGDWYCEEHRGEANRNWVRNFERWFARFTPEEKRQWLSQYRKRRYYKAKQDGKCVVCGEDKDPGGTQPYCSHHKRK